MHIASRLPQLLTTTPNIKNIYVKDKLIVVGKNGGKIGLIIQDILTWFNNSSELFTNDICKQLNITKEQYDRLVEDSFNELNDTSPEMILHRVYAQKKII